MNSDYRRLYAAAYGRIPGGSRETSHRTDCRPSYAGQNTHAGGV